MNWLAIATIILLVGYALRGRQVGFIRTVFSIFSILIALVLSVSLSPYISKGLQQSEAFHTFVNEKVESGLKIEDKEENTAEETQAIEGLKIPNSLKSALIENNNSEVYKALAINNFKGYVSGYLTIVVINAISFIVTFLVIKVLLFVLVRVLDIISKLPILNGLNKTAGLFVGILQGLVVIWVLCIVLTAFSGSKVGLEIYGLINESKFLSSIYDNNLLLNVVTNMAKALF